MIDEFEVQELAAQIFCHLASERIENFTYSAGDNGIRDLARQAIEAAMIFKQEADAEFPELKENSSLDDGGICMKCGQEWHVSGQGCDC